MDFKVLPPTLRICAKWSLFCARATPFECSIMELLENMQMLSSQREPNAHFLHSE